LAPAMHATLHEHAQHAARKYSKPEAEPTHLSLGGNHRAGPKGRWHRIFRTDQNRSGERPRRTHPAARAGQPGQNLTLRNILTSEEVACTGRKQPGTSGSCRSWGTDCPPEPKILARRVSTIRLEFAQSGSQKIQYPKRKSTQNQQIRSRILAAAPARPARPMGRESV
jgi:hypothetical protein